MEKGKKIYRITYYDIGIYEALKRNVDFSTWKTILESDAIKWLPKPPTYASSNKSYFTEKGYETFSTYTLPFISNYLKKEYIKIDVYDNIEHIIYEDEYQIVTEE